MSDSESVVEKTAPVAYQPRTDAEIRQLALDLVAGKVFTDRHIRADEWQSMVGSIFMVLGLGGPAIFTGIDPADIGFIYEYMDKAGPRGINGYPVFFSLHVVSKADANRVWDCMKAIEQALKAAPMVPVQE